jgi:hypothetical protein
MFEEGSLVLAALFLLVGLGVFVSPPRDVDIYSHTIVWRRVPFGAAKRYQKLLECC